MSDPLDPGTCELNQIRLQLREELVLTCDEFSGRPCYVIEDPVTSRFYRVGVAEYCFISLLDGETTVSEALAMTAKSQGRDAFTRLDAAAICRWLIDSELAYTDSSVQSDRLWSAARSSAEQKIASRLNPVFIKIPLFNPDRLLARALPFCSWLLGWPAFVLWTIAVVTGLYQIVSQSERFGAASLGILTPGNWIWLGLCWIALKVVHELFHGLVCKKFGGNVLECGIVLFLFAPIAYVDATGTWRLGSKWQRIYTSAAGMYVELFCAAIAAWVWSCTSAGIVNHFAYHAIIMAGVSTLVFNGNPLMRFDGYYILADLLEVPNLSSRGQQVVLNLGRTYLLGLRTEQPDYPRGKSTIIKIYGILAFAWRSLVFISILIAAHALFLGAGLIIAVLAALFWFGVPLARFVRYLAWGNSWERPSISRFLFTTGMMAALAGMVILTVPWPAVIRAPAVVRAAPLAVVRCEVAGFVDEILVQNDQDIEAGQIIARIVNKQLETEMHELELEILEAMRRRDHLRLDEQMPASQIQSQYIVAMQKRLADAERQHSRLIVRAPISGQVVRRQLASLQGTYVEPGSELLSIAGTGREMRVSIDQKDFDLFSQRINKPVRVYLRGASGRRLEGHLVRINPNASRKVPFPALSAVAGGPLAVRAFPDITQAKGGEPTVEFLSSRFQGTVNLLGPSTDRIHTGQLATVWFPSLHESIGHHIWNRFGAWLHNKIKDARYGA